MLVMVKEKRQRHFLNFPIDEDLLELLDEAAKQSGIVRAAQARACIEYALRYERKPFIPAAQQQAGPPFKKPIRKARRRLASV